MDLGSRLLKDRIIMCSGLIDTAMAEIIKMELYYLESEDPTADIKMYINSSGGSIVDGMAIYDAMQYVRPDVCTIVNGMAASMGSLLAMAGTKGKRWALPNVAYPKNPHFTADVFPFSVDTKKPYFTSLRTEKSCIFKTVSFSVSRILGKKGGGFPKQGYESSNHAASEPKVSNPSTACGIVTCWHDRLCQNLTIKHGCYNTSKALHLVFSVYFIVLLNKTMQGRKIWHFPAKNKENLQKGAAARYFNVQQLLFFH